MRRRNGLWQTVLPWVASYRAVVPAVLVLLLGIGGATARSEEASAREIPASVSSSSGEGVETDSATPRIALEWVDGYRLFAIGPDIMAWHVEAIFRDIGVSVTWKNDRATSVQPGDFEVRLMLRPSEPSGLGLPENAMGAILSRRSPQHTLFIFFPTVARALGYEPERLVGQMLRPREDIVLGRALARIIAHEVIHAVAPALPHAPKGLTRRNLTRAGLVEFEAIIDPGSAAVFRRELVKLSRQQREKKPAQRAGPEAFN